MGKSTIQKVIARKIFDGMGQPTIELAIETESGHATVAPSLAHPRTQGQFEIVHYPEGGVDEAIEIINKRLIPKLIGKDAASQMAIDKMLKEIDGTPNFRNIGGNTAEVVSTCVVKAAASSFEIPLFRYISSSDSIKLPNLLACLRDNVDFQKSLRNLDTHYIRFLSNLRSFACVDFVAD